MRAVQSEWYKGFVHAGKCIINSENRRSCKKCRFEKCLEVGMKVSYVKSLEEKCQKMVATIKNDTIPEVQFPDFPEQNYSEFYDSSWETAVWIIYEAYIKTPSVFLAHICQSPEVAMDTDDFLNFLEHTDTLIFSNLAKLQTEKDGVSEACQVLLRTNFTRLQAVQNILVFMEHFSEIERFIDFGKQNREKSHGLDQLIGLWDQHGSNIFSLDYELFFASPWALDKDIENEHRSIYKTVIYWYLQCQKGSPQLNKCFLTLIYAILLYNTDGINSDQLSCVEKIKKIQADYCHLLYQYLKSKHNSKVSHILYGKALMLIHETQRVYELSQLRLKLPNLTKVE